MKEKRKPKVVKRNAATKSRLAMLRNMERRFMEAIKGFDEHTPESEIRVAFHECRNQVIADALGVKL